MMPAYLYKNSKGYGPKKKPKSGSMKKKKPKSNMMRKKK